MPQLVAKDMTLTSCTKRAQSLAVKTQMKRRKNTYGHSKPFNKPHVAVATIVKPNPGYIGNMVL